MNQEIISIGKVLPNYQIYILDNYLQPLPLGITGEIYIGGVGVARGYLNRPKLTTEKFIVNPFGEGKLYKTGDLARYLPDGNIQFIGRIDNQIKIRGYRIELGEIETVLNQHIQVKESLVIARENEQKDKQLVAYIISDQKAILTSDDLRKYLQEKLPEYMIPTAYIPLEVFPLTPNGKIDRKALPKPARQHSLNTEIILPQTETEKKLAKIWQEVLRLDKEISINDNFFDLGGHSLSATQIVSRIRHKFIVELPLRYLFQFPTIAQLSHHIEILLNSQWSSSDYLKDAEIGEL
jgi:long-subunit acyl-CoA synthetase (AMP-forming)